MTKKDIFNQISILIQTSFKNYYVEIYEDVIQIGISNEDFKYYFTIRCQNFGEIYLLNIQGFFIRINHIEDIFRSLLFDKLIKNYNGDFTLSIGSSNIALTNVEYDFKIESISDLLRYNEIIIRNIYEGEKLFLIPMMDSKNIARYIAEFPFNENLKVLVGGQFPVHVFKKLFILYKGNQMARYIEYKEGIVNQLESYHIRKPEKQEEAKVYIENFNYLLYHIESEQLDGNNANPLLK